MPLRFSSSRPPIPPLDLIQRVVQPFDPADADEVRQAFDTAPVQQLQEIERALGVVGRQFSDFSRMLDFGCGPGRYIRHFGPLAESVEIHGADIDPVVIEWLRENVDYASFEVTPHEPPTAYEDGFFDLVLNHSVFTHLPEPLQDAWLTELQRIVRPGGVLLLTIHSLTQWNTAVAEMRGGGERVDHLVAELESRGILFIKDDHFVGSTHPDFYHSTFHAPWYVFEHWTRWFELAAYVPHGSHSQDLVVLRRRPDDVPAPRPIGHAASPSPSPSPASAAAAAPVAVADAAPVVDLDGVRAQLDRLQSIVEHRTAPAHAPARLKRRVLTHELGRQDRIDADIVATVRSLTAAVDTLASAPSSPVAEPRLPEEARREIAMLRAGLYEQGKRLTVAVDELRAELARRA